MSQYKKLKGCKASIRDKGIQEEYRSVEELSAKLYRHLTIVTRDMSVGATISRDIVKAARASTRADEPTETADPDAKGEVWLQSYTDKAFIVCGDTKPLKEDLKAAKAKWMKTRDGFWAWMFPKSRLDEVARLLGIAAEYRE